MGWQDILGGALTGFSTGDPMAWQRNKLEQAFKQFQMQQAMQELEMRKDMLTLEKQKADLAFKHSKYTLSDLFGGTTTDTVGNKDAGMAGGEEYAVPTGEPTKEVSRPLNLQELTQKFTQSDVPVDIAAKAIPFLTMMQKEKKPLAVGGKGVYEEGEFKEAPWADKEAFETFADPSGEVHWIAKGSDIPPGWKPYRPPSANVSVGVNVGGKGMTEVAKTMGETIVKERADVQQAAESYAGLREAEKLVKSGIITGTGAEYILAAGKALQQVGFNFAKDPVANTHAFIASMGKQVGTIIKQFGSGTGLSDADREYAEKIVGGKITLTEEAIKKIININKKAYKNVIRSYNKRAKQVMAKPEAKELPYNLIVDEPGTKTIKLPSGKTVQVEDE